jgi:hypothetical protein
MVKGMHANTHQAKSHILFRQKGIESTDTLLDDKRQTTLD